MAYKRLEANPEIEFDFFLAQKLGMTVGELRTRMGNEEFVMWNIYFARKAQRQELESKKTGK